MRLEAERRLFQAVIAAAALVPISTGLAGVIDSAAMIRGVDGPLPVDLDSHFRYLSGLLLGIGLAFLAAIPRVETKGRLIRALGAIVVIGGLARLVSLLTQSVPGPGHVFGLVMELIVVPAILLWHLRLERRLVAR